MVFLLEQLNVQEHDASISEKVREVEEVTWRMPPQVTCELGPSDGQLLTPSLSLGMWVPWFPRWGQVQGCSLESDLLLRLSGLSLGLNPRKASNKPELLAGGCETHSSGRRPSAAA